jgi:signal transduction histidine kinase
MNEKPTYDELMKYAAELKAKVERLELELEENRIRTDRLKSRFLASISHELRTPMNAILGFSNLMIDKNLSLDKKEEYVEHINVNSNNLLNIVDSMIDVSLLETNELRLNKEAFNLDLIIQQLYRFFNIERHKCRKDHIAMLLNNKKHEGGFIIYSDSHRLSQVLSCLLQNALKFTSKGIIEFGYFVREDNKLQFFVKDSGKGILGEKAKSIFNKFEKLDDDYGKSESGVGLGLTLAKGIVSLLGGDIWVESNIFKGSTFNFTIDYLEQGEEIKEKSISFQTILV